MLQLNIVYLITNIYMHGRYLQAYRVTIKICVKFIPPVNDHFYSIKLNISQKAVMYTL
jgi:hypothetical protein